jgi:prephenate dehydrogenase
MLAQTTHDRSNAMTSHLSHLLATQRMNDLAHAAEQARRAKGAAEPSGEGSRSSARTVIRVRLRGLARQRLRVRRA